jgi:hypothetical protein
MKKRSMAVTAGAISIALVLGTSITAWGSEAGGSRYCPAGRDMTLGSNTGSGYIYHRHTNITTGASWTKDWVNASAGWRYSSAGYEDVSWHITASSNIVGYTTGCYV